MMTRRGGSGGKERATDDVSIGKFEILATYTYARALLDGLDDDEAKQRGMVAAIIGRIGDGLASAKRSTGISKHRRKPPRRRKRRPSPPNRSTNGSLTRWAGFSTMCFFRI